MTTGSGLPRAYGARNDRRMKDRAVRRWGSFDSLLLEQVCLPPASIIIERFAARCNTREVTWGVDCGMSALCSESIIHRNIVDISTPTCYNQSETSERSSEDREPSPVLTIGSAIGQGVSAAIDGKKLNSKEVVYTSMATGTINCLSCLGAGIGTALQGMPAISTTTTTLANSLNAAWSFVSESVCDFLGTISSLLPW